MSSAAARSSTKPRTVSDFTRRTLRAWAGVALVHGAALVVTAAVLIPWKTPWANAAILAYGVLQATTSIGLVRCARWGRSLALAASLIGLGGGVLVVTGLLASWLYLKAVYGVFGYGASLVALLFAAVAFQLLGLVPALELRALLRREVRRDFGRAKRARAVLLVLLWLPLAAILLSYAPYRLDPLPPLSASARDETIAALRAALAGDELPGLARLETEPLGPGPLYVSLWHRGRLLARVRGTGSTMADAVRRAAGSLRERGPGLEHAAAARLKVDRVVAVGEVPTEAEPVVALSVVPGADGLRRRGGDGEQVLLPDDMIRNDRFGLAPLLPRLGEVRLGLDAGWALHRLRAGTGALERLRVESWVETEAGAVLVERGTTEPAAHGAEAWRHAAHRGGRYLLRHQRKDGRFVYRYRALDDRRQGTSDASLARHAGAVYALSQLYRTFRERRFARGARRAAAWLVRRRLERCASHRCVVDRRRVKLGYSALTAIGLLEYERSTGDDRFAEAARDLCDFASDMQRDDGSFYHRRIGRHGPPDPDHVTMFASEQAALALLLGHEVLGDDRYLQAARRALDYLTDDKYDYFLGWFTYGADHWTCLAAEEAWPRLRSPHYLDFCLGYADFIGRLQFRGVPAAYDGHYGFSGLMVPQAPATAGFTEAIAATYALSRWHGRPSAPVHDQLAAALDALVRDQLREDNSYLAAEPAAARGAIRRSPVQSEVRIDFVQHAVSALLQGLWATDERLDDRAPPEDGRSRGAQDV